MRRISAVLLLSVGCSPCLYPQERTLDELETSAAQGDAAAMFLVGYKFYNGDGVPQDYTEAARWFKLSADLEYSPAEFMLGGVYSLGQGIPKNLDAAVASWISAGEHGNAAAQNKL